MVDPVEIHVHTYAVARLAGVTPHEPLAVALRAILSRSFPPGEPPPIRARQRERAAERTHAAEAEVAALRPVPVKDFGFSQRAGALWIIRDALPDFRAMPPAWKARTTATMMFDRQHDLSKALIAFGESPKGFRAWCAGELSLNAHLQTVDRSFFKDLLGDLDPATITCGGIPTITTREGLVWIGLIPHDGTEVLSIRRSSIASNRMASEDQTESRGGSAVATGQATASAVDTSAPSIISTEPAYWGVRLGHLGESGLAGALPVLQTATALEVVGARVSQAVLRELSDLTVAEFGTVVQRLRDDGWLATYHPDRAAEPVVAVNATAVTTILRTFEQPFREKNWLLRSVITRAAELQTVSPAVRATLLAHPLTETLYENEPQRRLRLLINVLQTDDPDRVACAIKLAPHDPENALTAILDYMHAYPGEDYVLPAALISCVAASASDAYERIWPVVADQARLRSQDLIEQLAKGEVSQAWRFPKTLAEAVDTLWFISQADVADLCRSAFVGEHQCWTLWLATPRRTRHLLSLISMADLHPLLHRYYDALTGEALSDHTEK